MQETNEITLIICAYNCEIYIGETLLCIINQTHQKFDLLIVDDCSTDHTKNRIDNFLSKNNRLYEIVSFEENKGIGYARHFAEGYAKTKYLLFVDADDLIYPKLVEQLYNKIKSDDDLMAVGCYLEYIDGSSKKIGGGTFLGEKTKNAFWEKAENKKLIFMPITAIYNREISLSVGGFNITGFPSGKPRYQDFCEELDLWTRMSDLYSKGKAIVVVPEILFGYRKLNSGLSANGLPMLLKMRYVKVNLLRRRAGEPELTFIDFYNSLSEKELHYYKTEAETAAKLRSGVFHLKKGKVLKGFLEVFEVMLKNPKYLWQKIKSNSGIFR